MAVNQQFDEITSHIRSLTLLLQEDLNKLLKLGPSDEYRTPLRDAAGDLALLRIIVEHMESNERPLYFLSQSATRRLRPDPSVVIPDILKEHIINE
jgi:hypothetical protein